jgi:ferric-dicitrate binding protein FerR (iron transport regulator)
VKLKEISELIKKYNRGEASEAEEALIIEWYERIQGAEARFASGEFERLKRRVSQNLMRYRSGKTLPAKGILLWRYIAVAVSLIVVFGAGIWFYSLSRSGAETSSVRAAVNDVAPGRNGATITLANGKVLKLSDTKSGVVIGNVLKYSDGSDVRYPSGSSRGELGTGSSSGSLEGSQSNTGPVQVRSVSPSELQGADGTAQTLTANTAKGQTYQFTLPDGSKVWLNAASSLKFPSSFSKLSERVVELNGEGYFEVSKDKSRPFIVKSAGQQVEVFGTHFNINSYPDEPATKTSLLEGSVGIERAIGGFSARLKPGQQAVSTNGGINVVEGVAADAVDWKNGEFIFNDEPLESIMRKIARWYNMEVVYKGVDRKETFGGSISRFENVSKVLENLQLTGGIHFTIAGKKVIVRGQE